MARKRECVTRQSFARSLQACVLRRSEAHLELKGDVLGNSTGYIAWDLCRSKTLDHASATQHHITDVREICYSWHPWHGRAVRVHTSLVKRGQAVAYYRLEDVLACRVLEIPLWMLDVAACCKTRASKSVFASAQSLRGLKEILQAARPRVLAPMAPKTQSRY
jgi:hypothetical protein